MKYLILALLLLTGCITPEFVVRPQYNVIGFNQSELNLTSELSSDVFELDYNGSLGIGFIAEHKLISVHHMFADLKDNSDPDLKVFGSCDIPGLEICEEEHLDGTPIYYSSKYGVNYGVIINNEFDDWAHIKCMQPVIEGESGTPVKCIAHHKVIGVISNYDAKDELTLLMNGVAYKCNVQGYFRYLTKPKLKQIEENTYKSGGLK